METHILQNGKTKGISFPQRQYKIGIPLPQMAKQMESRLRAMYAAQVGMTMMMMMTTTTTIPRRVMKMETHILQNGKTKGISFPQRQ